MDGVAAHESDAAHSFSLAFVRQSIERLLPWLEVGLFNIFAGKSEAIEALFEIVGSEGGAH